MPSESRIKLRTPITVQASAVMTAPDFSTGAETPIDNRYSAGTENGLGAEYVRMTVNVTGAPGGDTTVEIWTAKYDDLNSVYEAYESSLTVKVPSGGLGSYTGGFILLNSTLTKAKMKSIDQNMTASLIATPVTCESQ